MDTLPLVTPEQVGLSAARLDRVRTWMHQWVDSGKLPGMVGCVMRKGELAFAEVVGKSDLARDKPMRADTIFRIYSMTKPLTSVAIMMLYEEGRFQLDDPITRFLPEFAGQRVMTGGGYGSVQTEPAERDITFRDLLTHTSGLTYGGEPGAVSGLYDQKATNFGVDDGPLTEVVDRLAAIPLLFEPGERWHYSVSLDVLGRVLEIVDGLPLDQVLARRVLEPVGMIDTSFRMSPGKQERLASLYQAAGDGFTRIPEGVGYPGGTEVTTLSGGAGLLSTAEDFTRFATMLLCGGEVDGSRVISSASAAQMQRNHLPGDIAACGEPTFSESTTHGVGFGLGGSVVVDPSVTDWPSSRGEYAWGGYASTAFLIDPVRRCTAVFFTQLIPSSRYPGLRRGLREIVARFVPPFEHH